MSLSDQVSTSIEAAPELADPKYSAICELARTYAKQIEAGVLEGGQDATKALYLGPHLLKTLGEMGLSPNPPVKNPVGRPVKAAGAAGSEEEKDDLARARERHRGRGA